jgi:ectoine hydroxylase-related dioxygenase (phytanoyl-CoA dioxygenase family)
VRGRSNVRLRTMTLASAKIDAGYRILDGVFGTQETVDLLRWLEHSSLARSRAGARHLMQHAELRHVAEDPRLLAIAADFVGESPCPYRATLFDKSPDRNWLVTWHQDTALPLEERREAPDWGPWSVKSGITYAHAPARALSRVVALRLHFDDSEVDNGPLRLIPGTHSRGVLSDAAIDEIVARTSPVDCLVAIGGIVAMRPLILHASSKAERPRPRRVLHIEYADSLDTTDGFRIAMA